MEKMNIYYYDRITMAFDDLLKCKRYSELMLKLPIGKSFSNERIIYEALFMSLVISYGRVFTTSNTVEKNYKDIISNKFGSFRDKMIKKQELRFEKLHKRILELRDTTIAHSDGISRNYKHYNNLALAFGRNPFYPFEHEEIKDVLLLINNLINLIGDEQSKVGNFTFKNFI
ncbi:MAG: hypothetical protein KA040_00150 [Aliarcobacter sp.]|nr:hypothetical protein [Aliarcobacter sp.]